MKNQAKHYSVISCFIIALLVNAMVPAFASLLPDSKVLLCTSKGYEWVDLQLDSDGVNDSGALEHCLLCLLSDDDDESVIASIAVFTNLESDDAKLALSYFDSFEGQFLDYIALGRAPPLTT